MGKFKRSTETVSSSSYFSKLKKTYEELRKEMGRDKVFTLDQHHGDMIEVAPGWGHAVENLSPNVKIAWDRCQWKHLRNYVVSWKRHAKLKVPGDYALLDQHLLKMARFALGRLLLNLR
jgi:hypothetical protein